MILTAYVKPNAKENKIVEWIDEDTVKISVTASPEKGRANQAVLKLLSKKFKIPRSSLEIIRGRTTRIKQIKIEN